MSSFAASNVNGQAALEACDLSHAFTGVPGGLVLDRVTLSVPPGSFVSIVGPSGCGKSTLLRVFAGLVAPSAGTARVEGTPAAGRPGLVAYMPQRDLLLPWRRTLANATLGAEVSGVPAHEARRAALRLLPRFGLEGFERAWPSQLSGGMRQRLALLRTVLVPRNVLLLDEPFGALDAITRRSMQRWLEEVWLEDRRTVLLVTHDVEEALMLSDEVMVMSPRPGRIVRQVAVPFVRPRDTRIAAEPSFVALKAELLAALDSSVGTPVG
jgi:ABC-type nitrate/sulfonate/bicarbonate transport system ATPase subunit